LFVLIVPAAVGAQELSRVDLEVGFGHVVHPGRNSRPSPSTISLGVGIWLSDSWGFGAVHVRGRGFSLNDPIRETSDRLALGQQGLRYTRLVGRYRRNLSQALVLQVGGGVILGGSRQLVELLKTPEGPVKSSPRYPWGSIPAAEAFVGGQLGGDVRARFGLVIDGDPESITIQPTMGAVIAF
jgi:hypothetical protein